MNHWSDTAFFYHIYTLGFCGAPHRNDFTAKPVPRLRKIHGLLDHIQSLGADAVYLGPLFESASHGYDTKDFRTVDRRLGTNRDLTELSAELHRRGIRLVLDGVFNHTGKEFPPFDDLRKNLRASSYAGWFRGVDFDKQSKGGDSFYCDGWNGHFSLAKLELQNREVRDYLLESVRQWITEFDIDGLRLDTADCLDPDFLAELSAFCKKIKPDFWLMGEVIHGDYTKWANPSMADSVTNYELYKGLWSSHNDANYFEVAYSLKRQFGEEGIYKGLHLYNFADNHDVSRVATSLVTPGHLYPLHILLFTVPGIPSIYYGSEFGIEGKKLDTDDWNLRPELDHISLETGALHRDLAQTISRLAGIRKHLPALAHGSYRQIHVGHSQFAFSREYAGGTVIIAVNSENNPAEFEIRCAAGRYRDILNGGDYDAAGGTISLKLHPDWGAIMVKE